MQNMQVGQVDGNGRKLVAKDFFVYQQNFDSLVNDTSDTGNINIQADSDFQLQKLTLFTSVSGAAQTADSRVIPLVEIQITDTGSGRNLFEESIAASAIFGTGELPFILPTPKIFPARATITVGVSNFSASQTYDLKFSFIGQKLFYTG